MPISIACISHQLLLLEGIETSVAGSEFDVSLVRFQGRLMLDKLALDPPRLLLLDGGCPKFSALVLVDRLKRALPQTQLMVYLRSTRAAECQSLLSMGVMGLIDCQHESSRCVIWWWTESTLQTSPSNFVYQCQP